MRPFRFGVNARIAASRSEWQDKARKVEDLGYASLSVPDHLAEMLAPLPAVVSAAEATRHLVVGTNVLNNDFRHPVLLAREAATIDLLTDGRLQLGLGAGYMKAEYDQAGLGFDRGDTRVERLSEAVVVLKKLFTGESVTFAGRHYRVTDHRLYPLPVQRPQPRILIGGNGPKLLTLAARDADIVGLTGLTFSRGGTAPDLSGFPAAAVDARIRLLREAAGDRFPQLELNALVQRVIVTDDRRGAAEELTSRWSQLTVEDILETPYVFIGTEEQIVEQIHARRERWGLTYYVIFEPNVDAFAPIVARLSGK